MTIPAGQKLRVLIADDSATVRTVLTSLLEEDGSIKVVGEAADGVEAVEQNRRLKPDIVTMDVKMPRLDGLEATAAIMATAPARILVVCSVNEEGQQDLSFRAIAAGALELIVKPRSRSPADLRAWGRKVAEAVHLMEEVPVVTRRRSLLGLDPYERAVGSSWPSTQLQGSLDAFGLVASTGGPPALAQILGALPANLPVPIFLAQHMAPGFVSGLTRWLATVTPLKVLALKSPTAAMPGHVYLPTDGQDLFVDEEGLIHTAPSSGGAVPSGDRLLDSLAKAYGPRAGAVVLTGMGDDGAQGLLALRKAGGATFAQDEATCVVYGMPKAAHDCGASQAMLPVSSVAGVIRSLCERRRSGVA